MWLFLTRRLRTWLLLTVLVPLARGLLRRSGQMLERRAGPTGVSTTLQKVAGLGERSGRGRRGRRRRW